jgi:RecA-family ATPase
LVPGIIPLGKLVMLAGDGGHGKSAMTLDLAACLTTGRPCLGLTYAPLPPAEVLLISCEDDLADTIVPRLLAAEADLTRCHSVDGVRDASGKCAPFSMAHFQAMEQELKKRPNVRLVVIDPAGAFVGRTGVDDHKDSELRALLGPLAEVAASRGVTILIVKHFHKGATARAVHKVSGGVGYVNAVRAGFVAVPDPEDEDRRLFLPLKFNLGPRPAGLAYQTRSLDPNEAQAILARFDHLEPEDRERLAQQLFRIKWLGTVDASADDAVNAFGKREQGPNKVEKATEWVREFLAEFAYPSEEIMAAAKAAGFTFDNVKEAKARLKSEGLYSTCKGFQGAWWSGFGKPEGWTLRPTPHTPHTPDAPQSGKDGYTTRTCANGSAPHSGQSGESFQSGESGERVECGDSGESAYRREDNPFDQPDEKP